MSSVEIYYFHTLQCDKSCYHDLDLLHFQDYIVCYFILCYITYALYSILFSFPFYYSKLWIIMSQITVLYCSYIVHLQYDEHIGYLWHIIDIINVNVIFILFYKSYQSLHTHIPPQFITFSNIWARSFLIVDVKTYYYVFSHDLFLCYFIFDHTHVTIS